MNFELVLKDLGIRYNARETGGRTAYVVHCPYCVSGKHKNDSGAFFASESKIYYKCWRGCYPTSGGAAQVLSDCSGVDIKTVFDSLRQYSEYYAKSLENKVTHNTVQMPACLPFADGVYEAYLNGRGFSELAWKDLLFTPHSHTFYYENDSVTKPMEISNRVLFPVYDKYKKLLTFTGRSILTNPKVRYIFPRATEYNMKDCGWSPCGETDTIVIVEGPFDALKLWWARCCCGISYSQGFVNYIAKNYKRCVVLFDPNEVQAKRQERKLRKELSMLMPVDIYEYKFTHDIGDCTKEEVMQLQKDMGLPLKVDHLL